MITMIIILGAKFDRRKQMKALEGIKVIDLSKWLPGQYCGMVLGDFGADVIKIDDIAGDSTRQFIPQKEKGHSS